MRRLYAALLAAALVAVVGCSPDDAPAPATNAPSSSSTPSSATSSSATSGDSVSPAWQARVRVRPDWWGEGAPWVWRYSDDIVVVGPRGLVALDRETGAQVWRLPLGARVCGATRSPSEVGLVALVLGRCEAGAAARRSTVTVVDLESASVVWERPFVGSPRLDVGGEVLVATSGCSARRLDLITGEPLGRIDASCSERVLVGHGTVLVSTPASDRASQHRWRAVDVASGSVVADLTGPATMAEPRRILTGDPLVVLADSADDERADLVRVDADELRVLTTLPSASVAGFFAWSGDSLVLADQALPGATEFSVEDGSSLGGFPGVPAARWVPFDLYGDAILGFETGGRLSLRSLHDGSATMLGGVGESAAKVDLEVAGRQAVVIDDILLVPGPAHASVLAYRLTVPEDD